MSQMYRMKNRKLATVAKWINANLAVHGYNATVTKSHENTDTKAGNFLVRGKGRDGYKLVITLNNEVVVDHCSARTYSYTERLESEVRAICKKLGMRNEYFHSRAVLIQAA